MDETMTTGDAVDRSPVADDGERAHAPSVGDGRSSYGRLAAFLLAAIALAVVLHGVAVLVVVLALVVMVMVHEFGHFITAKASGMKVTEYFLGFGPKLWSVRRGETEYGVKAIPAGGYVRIIGMTSTDVVDPADEPRTFRQATFPRRIAVAVAGSTMHFVMAFLLLWGLFVFAGLPVASAAKITSLASFANMQTPAKAAGLRSGDVIVSIDGRQYSDPQRYVAFIDAHPDQRLAFVVRRGGRDVTLSVRPADRRDVEVKTSTGLSPLAPKTAHPSGVIGVEIDYLTKNVTTNPLIGVQRAGAMLGTTTVTTLTGIGQVFSAHGLESFYHSVVTAGSHGKGTSGASSGSSSGQLLSIYGAISIGAQAAQTDIPLLLYLLVAINLFVGIINLFPMLPLDGGHVLVAVYERVRSRRNRPYHADVTKMMPIVYLFLAFIVVMGMSALYANIVQPVTLPGR